MQAEKSLKCPNCLSSVSDDLGFCPNCTVDLYNCSSCNALILETDTICKNCNSKFGEEKVNEPSDDILSPRSAYEYKSLEVITKILVIFLASQIFFSLINIYAVANDLSFIKANMDSAGILYDDELSFKNLLISASQVLSVIVFLTSTILYFIWVRRSYRNLHTLQLKPTEFSSGWAISSYFVLILNLFRPYTMMKEVWFGSQPESNLEDESNSEFHERRTSTSFLAIWWTAFLINGAANNFSLRLSLKADTTQKLLTNYWFDIISSVTGIFLSLLILYLVWTIKDWQSEKMKSKPTRYCQHCGNKVEFDALLCTHCGKQLIYNN